MEHDSLPSSLDYLQPVIQHFIDNPLSESCEDTDTSVLEAALMQRVEGLTAAKAEQRLRKDRKALATWLRHSNNSESPAHFILGWMMMGIGPLLGNEDMIGIVSDMISDLPKPRPGHVSGPLPKIEQIKSNLLSEDGNLFLYVGNATCDPKQVDICVEIDGNTVVHDIFEQQLMHDFVRYRIHIHRGTHRVVATSQIAGVRLEETIQMRDTLHACIRFWYTSPNAFDAELPPCFTFYAEEKEWIPEYGWRRAK